MTGQQRYEIHGAIGSPYSLKVRAAMRAKRLAHDWISLRASERDRVLANVRARVIPVIRCPDGSWTNDSTPFLLSIEGLGRRLVPDDPALRFACLLLEDMADEWFMKAMFHYRWSYAPDQEWCANWLMYDSMPQAGRGRIEEAAASIRARQMDRRALVGCTPQTAPLIEASWKRSCLALQDMALGPSDFLFGNRISLADLAFFGQLRVMSADPTPMAWLRASVPYLYRWLDHADDASDPSGNWSDPDMALAAGPVRSLLAQAGDTYLPFLKANLEAIERGAADFSVGIEGGTFAQATFAYQARCLAFLRQEWASLPVPARETLSGLIGEGASILG